VPVFVVGANFRSAPLELLERLAIDAERRPKALAGLLDQEHVHEAVVVSTCNRVEVYTAISRFHGAAGDVRRFLADLAGLALGELADHLYDYYEERAVQHLFTVASGVDSMVVGEAQILRQVREAFGAAQAERSVGPVLSALFTRAIKVGRRARNETGIGDGMASTVTVGLRVAAGQLDGLAGRPRWSGRAASGPARPGAARGRAGELPAPTAPSHRRRSGPGAGGRCPPRRSPASWPADLAVAATAGTTPTGPRPRLPPLCPARAARRGRPGPAGPARPGRP
jgi:glutamyl-tRNA reductase